MIKQFFRNAFLQRFNTMRLGLFIGLTLIMTALPLQATINDTFSNTKLSTNFVNLIGLGDLNLTVETKIKEKESLLIGAHKNSDIETNKYSGEEGGFIGYRVYPSLISMNTGLSGEYFQLTFGANKEHDNYAKSVEFWVGKSTYLGTNLGIEFGVGLGRKFKSKSAPIALAGINLIYSL